jgi:O-antigen/teichoic acid export membrane protein
MGAMAINAALGFAYWWLAARLFSPTAVGLASAAVSAMMLLGNAGMLGLGTLLLGELPRRPGREGELIGVGLSVAAVAGAALGVIFALASPLIAGELGVLAGSIGNIALFALGAGLTAVSLVLDQALVGLARGMAQLRRNVAFAVSKLALLYLAGLWAGNGSGLVIYATWVAGIVFSFALVIRAVPAGGFSPGSPAHAWGLLRGLGRAAAAHHVLNLVMQAPGLALPLIVTAVLSAEVNAGFYIAWMMTGLVFIGPDSLATVLYSASAADPGNLAQRLRRLGLLSLALGLAANMALLILARPVLALFGQSYADNAAPGLTILALGVFPLIVRYYYVAVRRIEGRIASTATWMAGGGLLELIAATAGAYHSGLPGLCLGWVLALCVQAVLLAPTVLRATRTGARPVGIEG